MENHRVVGILKAVYRVMERDAKDIRDMKKFIEDTYENMSPYRQEEASRLLEQLAHHQVENNRDASVIEYLGDMPPQNKTTKEKSWTDKLLDMFSPF